jgi:hypothetical protein
MADPIHLHLFRRIRLNFTWKIILIAITLLAFSQVLGTLISVSTYETLLLKTLTTKYEILGKDLKRRIEHSLKFGKRLDHFIGMEKLVTPVYHLSEDIDKILIFDLQGTLFFSSKRVSVSQSDNSSQSALNSPVFLVDSTKNRIDLPIQYFSNPNETTRGILLYQGNYYVLFNIHTSLSNKQGMLALTFKQSVLDRQKYKLIKSAGSKLLLSLILTATIMGIMIHLFFTKPSRKQANHLIQKIHSHTNQEKTYKISGHDDMIHVYGLMTTFQADILEAQTTLSHTLHELNKLNPDNTIDGSIKSMQLALKRKQDETA